MGGAGKGKGPMGVMGRGVGSREKQASLSDYRWPVSPGVGAVLSGRSASERAQKTKPCEFAASRSTARLPTTNDSPTAN